MACCSDKSFEFIVVGAGASGCTLATRIASSAKRPQVLLIEAGGKNDTKEWKRDAERWVHRLNHAMTWPSTTVPQKHANGNVVQFDHGKGLGGGTAINFAVWNVGPKDDHDFIAEIVGDSEWKWETGAQPRYIRLEDYYGDEPDVPPGYQSYLDPNPKDHGHGGPVKIGFPRVWEKSVKELMDIWFDSGCPANPDLSSGNVLGLSVAPNSVFRGIRSTAADQLRTAPANLQVMTDAHVARITFNGKVANGVELVNGRRLYATKEVILCAGALDSPRILMHSGIGPSDQLMRFNIPVLVDNSCIGQTLMDHPHVAMTWHFESEWARERLLFYRSEELKAVARAQWDKDQTGPLSELGCVPVLGFLKSDAVLDSEEFHQLPDNIQKHISCSTVPTYEFALNCAVPEYFIDPANAVPMVPIVIFLMNPQSTGQCILQSSDPALPLSYDPNFLSHPYDKRMAVESTRETMKIIKGSAFSKYNRGMVTGPESDGEEDILQFWRNNVSSTHHMCGTVRMGKERDGACVGNDFRVFGIEALRVSDMSVLPIMPNNHTQTTAYLVGLMAGDRIASEYDLDVV